MSKLIFILKIMITLFIALILAACASKPEQTLDKQIQPFAYNDLNKATYGLEQLKGNVWIADFIFTECETLCPMQTENMRMLQTYLKERNIPVQFVSFSVDPEHDTTEELNKFVKKHRADTSNWHFLNGYSFESIQKFAKDSFLTTVDKPVVNDVMHSTSFFLVNKQGFLTQKFSGTSTMPLNDIADAVKAWNEVNE